MPVIFDPRIAIRPNRGTMWSHSTIPSPLWPLPIPHIDQHSILKAFRCISNGFQLSPPLGTSRISTKWAPRRQNLECRRIHQKDLLGHPFQWSDCPGFDFADSGQSVPAYLWTQKYSSCYSRCIRFSRSGRSFCRHSYGQLFRTEIQVSFCVKTNWFRKFHWIIFQSRTFGTTMCTKISSMVQKLSTPLDLKLRLIPIFQHMHHDAATASTVCLHYWFWV